MDELLKLLRSLPPELSPALALVVAILYQRLVKKETELKELSTKKDEEIKDLTADLIETAKELGATQRGLDLLHEKHERGSGRASSPPRSS